MNFNDANQYNEPKKKSQEKMDAYQDYLERISSPPCPVKLTPEQIEELRKKGYHL